MTDNVENNKGKTARGEILKAIDNTSLFQWWLLQSTRSNRNCCVLLPFGF